MLYGVHKSEHSRVFRNKQFNYVTLQLTNICLLVWNEFHNGAMKYM